VNQNDRELKLYQALINRRQELPMPPEVLAELRAWWAERDREWWEKLKADIEPPDSHHQHRRST